MTVAAAFVAACACDAAVAGVRTPPVQTTTVYVDTSPCAGLVQPQPGFLPDGTTIGGDASISITATTGADPLAATVRARVQGTARDTVSHRTYDFSFLSNPTRQASGDFLGTGMLTFRLHGDPSPEMHVRAALVWTGVPVFSNVGPAVCH